MKKRVLFFIAALSLILNACESKVSEKQADGTANASGSVQQRVANQKELDTKITQIQDYANKLKTLLSGVEKIINTNDLASMSIFDVIYQINNKIQNEREKVKDQGLYILGDFTLNTTLLSDDCQTFKYLATSDKIDQISRLTYSLESCYSPEQFLPVVNATFQDNALTVNIQNDNFQQILPVEKIIRQNLPKQLSSCTFSTTQPSDCKDVMFAETKNLVWFLNMHSDGDTQFSAYAMSKRTGNHVYELSATFDKKGQLLSDSVQMRGPFAEEPSDDGAQAIK